MIPFGDDMKVKYTPHCVESIVHSFFVVEANCCSPHVECTFERSSRTRTSSTAIWTS
jgi:hypothetical protein